jgi:hypothetical protein
MNDEGALISCRWWFILALQPCFKIGQGTIPAEYLHYDCKRQTRDMEYLYREIFPSREGAEYQEKNPEEMQKNNKIRCRSIEHEDILKRRKGEHQEDRFIKISERHGRRGFFIFFHIFFISSSYFSSMLYLVSECFFNAAASSPPSRTGCHPPKHVRR